jgi:large subunit ribosomal protein L10
MKEEHKAKIANWKKTRVEEFVELLNEYPIIGAVNLENVPAKQMQNMRDTLRDTAVIKMTKRNLIKIAIEKVKDKKIGIEKIEENLKGMPALLFTKKNPFSLYKTLEKNKSSMPAKAGQIAPKDIIVPAGATNFSPGPIIGELGAFKIKTTIENGKVAIKNDSIVAKEGDVISPKLAEILTRLGIEPMELGLNITAIYENGIILKKDVLAIDESAYINNIKMLASEAVNLAVFIAYPASEVKEMLISKAHSEAYNLAIFAGITNKETTPKLLSKAESQMLALKKITS